MRSRHGLGVLALCGLALALMGIGATGAQAAGCTAAEPTAKPCWMVNGKNITSELKVTLGYERDPGTTPELPVLLMKSGANKVEIECHNWLLIIIIFPNGRYIWFLIWSNCLTRINGVRHEECDPINQPIEAGGEGEIALHEGAAVLKATGTGGGALATIEFAENCLLIEEPITLSGTAWIEDAEGKFETELGKHLIQEAKLAASMLGGLKFGANAASIDGSMIVSPTDEAHKGLKFSGLAG